MATGDKIERKYLAHFLEASFGGTTKNWVRLGKDLEEYNEELNPDVEITKNILGEQSVSHNGYEVQASVDPFYAREGDALFKQLEAIINGRLTGGDCKTQMATVRLAVNPGSGDPIYETCYIEDCYVIPDSMGGDTSGIQIPFTVYPDGNRVKGTFDIENSGAYTINAAS